MDAAWLAAMAGMAVAVVAVVGAIASIGVWAGRVQEHKSKTTGFIADALKELRTIRDVLTTMAGRPTAAAFGSQSPIRLNDLGKQISQEVDGPGWAKQHADRIRPHLRKELQPYDLQERCFRFVRLEYQPGMMRSMEIKRCAYDHGVSVDVVLDVLAIEMRDLLLSELEALQKQPPQKPQQTSSLD